MLGVFFAGPLAWGQTTDAERFEEAQRKLLEKKKAAAEAGTTAPATKAAATGTPRLESVIQQLHKAAINTFNDPKLKGVARDPRDPLTIRQFNDMAATAVADKVFDLSFNLADSDTIKQWGHAPKINRDGLRGILQKLAKSPLVAKSRIELEIPQQADAEMRQRLAQLDTKLTAELRQQEAEAAKGDAAHRKYHGELAKKAKANRDSELTRVRAEIAKTSMWTPARRRQFPPPKRRRPNRRAWCLRSTRPKARVARYRAWRAKFCRRFVPCRRVHRLTLSRSAAARRPR